MGMAALKAQAQMQTQAQAAPQLDLATVLQAQAQDATALIQQQLGINALQLGLPTALPQPSLLDAAVACVAQPSLLDAAAGYAAYPQLQQFAFQQQLVAAQTPSTIDSWLQAALAPN